MILSQNGAYPLMILVDIEKYLILIFLLTESNSKPCISGTMITRKPMATQEEDTPIPKKEEKVEEFYDDDEYYEEG